MHFLWANIYVPLRAIAKNWKALKCALRKLVNYSTSSQWNIIHLCNKKGVCLYGKRKIYSILVNTASCRLELGSITGDLLWSDGNF